MILSGVLNNHFLIVAEQKKIDTLIYVNQLFHLKVVVYIVDLFNLAILKANLEKSSHHTNLQ